MVASKLYFPHHIKIIYGIFIKYYYVLIGTSIKLNSNYNHETAPILLSNVRCSGIESRLAECPHSSGGNGFVATLDCFESSRKLN